VPLLLAFQDQPDRGLTNAEAAQAAKVSSRTARLHTARLVEFGILDVPRLFPGSRFRPAKATGGEGRAYLERWGQARAVVGL
jgi:hypothetical protein